MNAAQNCRWCGMAHGAICPVIKAIEYHADGITVKRVEFKTAADYPQTAPVYPVGPYPRPWDVTCGASLLEPRPRNIDWGLGGLLAINPAPDAAQAVAPTGCYRVIVGGKAA